MRTYLFYDVETSGLNPVFDQVLSFAGIRTDLNFSEIDRFSATIRLRRDIVPSPGAFLTHGLTFDELSQGISEYEAALRIHRLVNTPDTVSLGYNSLRFDDEFLRFMFYRNLLDPYTHQYKNGCCRMDGLPISVLYRVFFPDCLKWPETDGKPIMKLDLIAAENRFITSGRAHQAMNDVESLVALCRKLSQKQDVWTYCLNFFDRVKDVKRISAFQETMEIQGRSFKPGLMLSVSFGAAAGYLAPVLYLGRSVPYQNQGLWLRLDAEPATDRTDKNSLSMPVIRKRDGDGYFVLPPLQRFWEKVSETARVSATGHLENIRKEGKRFLESVDAHLEYRYPDVPDIDPDAALYQMGFFSTREKAQCHLFHQTPDDRKYGFVNQLDAGRIRELALRIIFRNEMPVPLDTDAQKMYERYLSRVYLSPQDHGIKGYQAETKLGCLQALEELEELKRKVLPDRSGTSQNKQISALKAYLENLSKLSG